MDGPSRPPDPGDRSVTSTVTTALPLEDRPPSPVARTIPRGLLWSLALAVVVLTIASWMALSADPPPDAGQHAGHVTAPVDLTGHPAPEASFDVLDGPATSLGALRGSPVVLNFWGAWCVPCITEMPAFEQVHQAYGDRVRFVGLSPDNEASARAQQRRTGVTYRLGIDPESQIARTFGIVSIPATVLIDRDGTVVHVSQGPALTAPSLTGLIAAKLGA
jgi:peroxiredoxin